MKTLIRISAVLMIFTGILTFPSLNYAATLVMKPIFKFRPQPAPAVPEIFKDRLELQSPPLVFKKKRMGSADSYSNAWKISRMFATSA